MFSYFNTISELFIDKNKLNHFLDIFHAYLSFLADLKRK